MYSGQLESMRGRMIVKRIILSALAVLSITGGNAAFAETQDIASCPASAVSVYFAQGETNASEASLDLIGRVGGVANDCRAVSVDLIAWVDPAEGIQAMGLALDRLKLVAEKLAEQGLAADQLRLAAKVRDMAAPATPGSRNVRIFVRPDATLTQADEPRHQPMRAVPAPISGI